MTITELARECAQLAWNQRTVAHEGETICSEKPLPGDWEALEELLGRKPTHDEVKLFEQSYEPGEGT